MYVPLVSPWLKSSTQNLERRAGGGGGGEGGGGEGGESGSGESGGEGSDAGDGSSSSSSGSGSSKGVSIPITSASGSSAHVKAYGSGSTSVSTIPAGQPFANRSTGGGMRDDVFGTRKYGSGYPNTSIADVAGRGFPFGFWPITFGDGAEPGAASEFHSLEYGDPSNSSRPGGPILEAPFRSSGDENIYRIVADNTTVRSLVESITSNCSRSTTSISAISLPRPEQVIQYYRSSSIALTLDGYNNTAVFSTTSNASDTPLPSTLNTTFLDCLNQTIGAAAPLLDNSATLGAQISGVLGLAWVALYVLRCS